MTRTIAEQRAAMPEAFRVMMDEIAAKAQANRLAGGPWQVWLPNPSGRGLRLHWSFATEQEAKDRIASMFPAIRKRAEIRKVSV